MMIMISARMVSRPDKRNEFVAIIRTLIPNIRKQKGCISLYFFQDWEQEEAYFICSYWKSLTLAEDHVKSDEFALLLNAFTLLKAPPDVKCSYFAPENGLNLIRKIRSGGTYSLT